MTDESIPEPTITDLPPLTPGLLLAKQAVVHLLVWLLAFALFAAADSWDNLTNLGIATFLSVLAGIVAGFTTTTLIHEWFHFIGAWISGADYKIPDKASLFVFDWQFDKNSLGQFYTMSIAGSIGSIAGIILLWNAVPTDSAGRAALLAAGVASLGFAASIEWPVLRRTQLGGDPLTELSRIDQGVLTRSLITAAVVGWIFWLLL